jgi:hypothetical protein
MRRRSLMMSRKRQQKNVRQKEPKTGTNDYPSDFSLHKKWF